MCIGVPMKLKEIKGNKGVVEINGVVKEINLDLIENPQVGDYLIVHAGFAIQKVDQNETEKTITDFGASQ